MSSKVVYAVAFYWVVSISLVFLNKAAMSGNLDLDAPLFLTWTQIVFAVLGCMALSASKQFSSMLNFFPQFDYRLDIAVKVLPLTVIFLGMIVFNNLCLKYVQVSFYQVARSLTIVFNILCSYLLLGETFSRKALMAVAVVIIGYLLGCDGEIDFSLTGVVFGITASVFVALYSIYVKKILNVVNNDSWVLLIYNNVNAMFILPIVFILVGEMDVISSTEVFSQSYFWFIVFFTGAFGFLINIASFAQIQATSPLTHNVSGTAKAGFQTVLAYLVYGNPTTAFGLFGVTLVLSGSLLYGYVRSSETEVGFAKLAQSDGEPLGEGVEMAVPEEDV